MPYVVVKEEAQAHHRAMTFGHLQVCIGEGVHWMCIVLHDLIWFRYQMFLLQSCYCTTQQSIWFQMWFTFGFKTDHQERIYCDFTIIYNGNSRA